MNRYPVLTTTAIISIIVLVLMFSFCGKKHDSGIVTQNIPKAPIADIINLSDLQSAMNNFKDAATLESYLNSSSFTHNVDLDGDGVPDYLSVNELREGNNLIYQVGVKTSQTTFEEIARSVVNQNGNYQISGNTRYYDPSRAVVSGMIAGVVIASLFAPRSYYVSPYYYGNTPGYYREVIKARPVIKKSVSKVYIEKYKAPLNTSSPTQNQRRDSSFSKDKMFDSGGTTGSTGNTSRQSFGGSTGNTSRQSFGGSTGTRQSFGGNTGNISTGNTSRSSFGGSTGSTGNTSRSSFGGSTGSTGNTSRSSFGGSTGSTGTRSSFGGNTGSSRSSSPSRRSR